jgi:hypothetical protein
MAFVIARSHVLTGQRLQFAELRRPTEERARQSVKAFLSEDCAQKFKHAATIWRDGDEFVSYHFWIDKSGEIQERKDVITKGEKVGQLAIALLNSERHKSGLCPHNHDIDYRNGWFRIDDGSPFRRSDLVKKAHQLFAQGVRATLNRNSWCLPS